MAPFYLSNFFPSMYSNSNFRYFTLLVVSYHLDMEIRKNHPNVNNFSGKVENFSYLKHWNESCR